MDQNTPCSCEKPGFCERYKRKMVGRLYQICQGTVLTPEKCAAYRANWLMLTEYAPAVLAAVETSKSPIERYESIMAGPDYWPCIYRGEEVDKRKCESCGMAGRTETVYKCELHELCTLRLYKKSGQPEKNCNYCLDRIENA